MPAENEFERSMQQLLDGLRVDPAPADWDAVYEKLHPSRKRRIIWWWMPVVASLLLTALWMRQEPAGNSQAVVPTRQQHPGPSEITATPSNTEPGETPAGPQPMPPATASGTKSNATTGNKQASGSGYAQTPHSVAMPAPNTTASIAPETPPVAGHTPSHTEPIPARPQESMPGLSHTADSSSGLHATAKEQARPDSLGNAALTMPASTGQAQIDTPVHQAAPPDTKKQARKWQWLLYAGGGYQSTTTPPAGTKAAMDLSTSTPGGSVLITQSETGDGYHLAAGALAQRQWHKNWKLQLGLGLNHSQWQGHTSVVRDSLPAGSMVSTRSLVSERNSQYRLWMLEMPMEIGLRLAGKKQDTWWLTTGFNHQLLLSLQEKHSTQQAATNFNTASGQQSLNSAASTYQLYWRMGLQLNHEGNKTRWQLAPLFQYGLTPVYKQNTSNMHLLNLQLQWRIYLTHQ